MDECGIAELCSDARPFKKLGNTQILVVIMRTICAVIDTELSCVGQNGRKNTAREAEQIWCKKPVIMGWSTKWGALTLQVHPTLCITH